MNATLEHTPVLLEQVLQFLQIRTGGTYVDCTVGLGGHAERILGRLEGSGRFIALDRDGEALEETRERLAPSHPNLQLFHENFKNLPLILNRQKIDKIDGCLVDLGVSSRQLNSAQRGFSFRREGPLDMRMDARQKTTAADLVNHLSEERLTELFRRYGEETSAPKIAASIIQQRNASTITTTSELSGVVESVKGKIRGRLHPATRVFQALRIEVNQELTGLDEFLKQTISFLTPGGRLLVISFHSLEDRIVKTVFRKESGKCVCFRPPDLCNCPKTVIVHILTRKPVTPDVEEIETNPRARSAKLRVAEKIKETSKRRNQTVD